MRIQLVRDAIRLASMAYWSKEDLEKLNVKFEENKEEEEEKKSDDQAVDVMDSNVTIDDIAATGGGAVAASGAIDEPLPGSDVDDEDDDATVSVTAVSPSVDVDESDKKKDDSPPSPTPPPPVVKTPTELIMEKIEKPIKFYSTTVDTQCFVTQYEDGCCIVFRGTTNAKDWMVNLDARYEPLDLPNIFGDSRPQVHQGFLRQYNSVAMTLMRHAMEYMNDKTIKDSNKTFYYFGHSLGGALSTLAAAIIGSMYPDARHVCITFGSPRVGDARFCELYRKNVDECVRCVNQEDPVPLVPSACRFEHVYGVHYVDKDHKIQDTITENRLLNTCRDSMLCCCGIAENPLDDHDTEQYEAAWKNIEV